MSISTRSRAPRIRNFSRQDAKIAKKRLHVEFFLCALCAFARFNSARMPNDLMQRLERTAARLQRSKGWVTPGTTPTKRVRSPRVSCNGFDAMPKSSRLRMMLSLAFPRQKNGALTPRFFELSAVTDQLSTEGYSAIPGLPLTFFSFGVLTFSSLTVLTSRR